MAAFTFSHSFIRLKSPDFSSPEDVLATVKSERAGKSYVLALGDSVMGSSSLEKQGIPQPQNVTIPADLEKLLHEHMPDVAFANGAMDGSLSGDFQGLISLLQKYSLLPSMVIIQIDYRLFSSTNDGEAHLSRKWLTPYVAYPVTTGKSIKKINYAVERPIDSFIYRQILLKSDAYLFIRIGWRQILGELMKKFYSPETGFDSKKINTDEGMALKLLVLPYYQGKEMFTAGHAIQILADTIDFLKRANVPVLLVYTPTNLDYLSPQIDVSAYRMNTDAIERWVYTRYGNQGTVQLLMLEGQFTSNAYYDHSHFTPEANKKIANLIFKNITIFRQKAKGQY